MTRKAANRNEGSVGVVRHILAGLLVAAPIASLLGWALDSPYLKSVIPGLTAMNPIVAVCFMALAVALPSAMKDHAYSRVCGALLGAVVVLASGARLIATWIGQDKTIDTLLFAQKLDAEHQPNRMAISTAWCLLASAVTVLLLATRLKRRVMTAQLVSLVAAGTGIVVVNCYAAQVLAGQTPGTAVPMAAHVALLFIVFSLTVMFFTPKYGVAAVLMSDAHSALFARRLMISLVIAPPIFAWLVHGGRLVGLYNVGYEQALLISLLTGFFAVNVWFAARSAGKAEARLRHVERKLRASKDRLEERIEERTVELKLANDTLRAEMDERKSLQEQFLQSQKMESLGALAGGIAHDFNNLLTGMLGYAEVALMKLPADSIIQADLEEIRKSAERAASLTKQLLTFARKEVVEPRIVDINELVHGLDSLLGRLLGESVELVTIARPDLGSVKIDPSQFEQVLVNLAVNARDAMPYGGQLLIETQNQVLDAPQQMHRGLVESGQYVVVSVTDSGNGMSKDVQSRVFEPFFTTKEKGRGTGLGLSTCYGIIRNSGGHIGVYSEPGHGTTFRIYLPRVDDQPDAQTLQRSTATASAGETVLIVEDEDTVRALGAEVMRTAGYHVLEAANGNAALQLIAEYREPIHLLLTDVVMPSMGGRELSEMLRIVRPEIRVLYMSGYTDDAMVLQGVLAQDMFFLQKPFAPVRLLQKLREVLDEAKAA